MSVPFVVLLAGFVVLLVALLVGIRVNRMLIQELDAALLRNAQLTEEMDDLRRRLAEAQARLTEREKLLARVLRN